MGTAELFAHEINPYKYSLNNYLANARTVEIVERIVKSLTENPDITCIDLFTDIQDIKGKRYEDYIYQIVAEAIMRVCPRDYSDLVKSYALSEWWKWRSTIDV